MGCATIVVGYFQVSSWFTACERQTRRLSGTLFRSILNKEIAYFDVNITGQLSTRLAEDINKVHDGAGDKIGSALQFFAAFLVGLVLEIKINIGYTAVSPLLFITIAEEVISSIRTVFSYNGAAYKSKRYVKHLRSVKLSGIRKGELNGALMSAIFFFIFCTYTLGFWYEAKLVHEEDFSIGGILIKDFIGDIKFTNVHFSHPSRIDVLVLNRLSFTAQRGQTTALVDSSGCEKSTCVQLLQRFYDPIDGSVEIDDIRVNQYNLSWLREHIGVVSQEPILFQTTIKENIRFGRMNAKTEEIVEAAKMTNTHNFIMELPEKYETLVGERAIARALIRNPRILLLDETTSALDRESESIVQDALNRASKGRTTIVITHRLSTIVNASKIIVHDKGSIIEEENHATLMNARGVYYGLVEAQNLRMQNNDQKEDDDDDDDTSINLLTQSHQS
ncbi:unnamed protein product [Rotaria sordida]|uniref:Uncharacterized protein n=1 Tax=Rotaria sordida TaxID=392033 RepID=A0A818WYX8_9BILA|nr:unnamed protein product [Rotaria sordida]